VFNLTSYAVAVLLGGLIYLFWSYKNLQIRMKKKEIETKQILDRFQDEMKGIQKTLKDIDDLVNGEKNQQDGIRYAGLYGMYGTVGRVKYIDERLSSLISVANKKFVDLGRKLDIHELVYTSSIDKLVLNHQFDHKRVSKKD
jgi:hypothetical protein